MMHHLQALLQCRICHSQLTTPTTLHCGHSICSVHNSCSCAEEPGDNSRPDVTLNKIINLVARFSQQDGEDDDWDLVDRIREEQQLMAKFEKELYRELTCEICLVLFYCPVTTPCQHTFCSKCLHRSLDHSAVCPICRTQLPGFSYFQEHPYNQVILSLILHSFADSYKARGEAIEAEERDARLNTPIFVCQLSFPGMPTLLHFFEPRYRLMLRRCLDSENPCFGMIMPPRPGSNSNMDYGTMLEIRSVQMLNDGRSMVETWGSWRFRILERGSLDGYMVGRIERIEDIPDDIHEEDQSEDEVVNMEDKEDSADGASSSTQHQIRPVRRRVSRPLSMTTRELTEHCLAFLNTLQNGTPWVSQRLSHAYGYGVYGPYGAYFVKDADGNYVLPPEHPQNSNTPDGHPFDLAGFSFWVGAVLPIDEAEKAKLLPVKSVRMRLQMCVWWIEGLRRHWWFSSGCIIF